MRCGIYVSIRDNQVKQFVPFANRHYRNSWGHLLRVDESFESFQDFYEQKTAVHKWSRNQVRYKHSARLVGSLAVVHFPYRVCRWWANCSMICNEHSPSVWGDAFLAEILDMLQTTCMECECVWL